MKLIKIRKTGYATHVEFFGTDYGISFFGYIRPFRIRPFFMKDGITVIQILSVNIYIPSRNKKGIH